MLSKFAQLVLLAGVFAQVGACGGDSGNKPADPAPPPATENEVNPMSRESLRAGGKFTFPMNAMPSNFNWNHLNGPDTDNQRVLAAIVPVAFSTDAKGTPVWNKDLLAAEPTVVREPKQVITYQINPKAVWYDGTPITWEDFYWQWKSTNGTDPRYVISSANGYEDISNVEKGKDEREVVVTFSHTFADWTSLFYYLYPASTNKDPRVFNEGWLTGALTSAGPFRIAAIDQTAKSIILVRNEKWWGNPALLDTVVFRAIDPDTQMDAVANGEIDAMDIGPDADKYVRSKSIVGSEVRRAAGPQFRHLTINGTGPILKDVVVRRALAMAIDRASIAKVMLSPLGLDARPLNNHIFMMNQDGYRDNAGLLSEFNVERAGQLLDSAGWKLDGATRKKDGKPLVVNFVIPTTIASAAQESEMIRSTLSVLGVDVKISSRPVSEMSTKVLGPGAFDFAVFSWIGTPYPMSSAKSIYAVPVKRADGTLDLKQNFARVGSSTIDSLFDMANAELDRSRIIAYGNRVDSLIWDEVHSLTLYQRPEMFVTKKNLANFGAFGFAQPWIFQDIGWMK